jgi:hypothetical protein
MTTRMSFSLTPSSSSCSERIAATAACALQRKHEKPPVKPPLLPPVGENRRTAGFTAVSAERESGGSSVELGEVHSVLLLVQLLLLPELAATTLLAASVLLHPVTLLSASIICCCCCQVHSEQGRRRQRQGGKRDTRDDNTDTGRLCCCCCSSEAGRQTQSAQLPPLNSCVCTEESSALQPGAWQQ